MSFRLIEVTLPEGNIEAVEELLSERKEALDVMMQPVLGSWKLPVLGVWKEKLATKQIMIRILVDAEKSEPLLDIFEDRFSKEEGFRINMLPVEASVPSLSEKEKSQVEGETPEEQKKAKGRISREELYDDLESAAKLTWVYVATIILSAIVAAVGVMDNNATFIIGAMVIAPLMGPNVALSLATTLGDLTLARNALKTNIVGISIALLLSVIIGFVLPVDPSTPEISSRTSVGLTEVVVALASGCAGALSFTSAAPAVLIGVAVAVSLLPPLVAFGLLLGSGYYFAALGALFLFLVNLISVNLAGVATFLAQGIAPRTWWEAKKAKKATRIAIALWLMLFAVLLIIIIASRGNETFIFRNWYWLPKL